MTVDT